MAGSDELSVGIIGFGRIGAEHAGWLDSATGVRPAAVFDPTPPRRAVAQQRGLLTVDSVEQLLHDSTIDAVLVSTPTAMHFEHASAALRAGKHVMVEKPMAIDARQARGLIELAEERRLLLSVFHNRRWDIDYLTISAAIENHLSAM